MLILRYDEQGIEKTHRLKEGTTLIGRLPTCDLVLNDPSVSRHHASVSMANGRYFVQDVGSRFGTFVNGERLLAVQDPVEIKAGDKLTLGELSAAVEQNPSETDLLTEDHDISVGPGAILKAVEAPAHQPVAAADAHLIKLTTGDGYTLRHKAGCFHVQYFTDVVWHVHDYVTNKLWRVFPQTDRDGDGYFIAVRGQIDPVKCGNTWLSVLDTIADNYDV